LQSAESGNHFWVAKQFVRLFPIERKLDLDLTVSAGWLFTMIPALLDWPPASGTSVSRGSSTPGSRCRFCLCRNQSTRALALGLFPTSAHSISSSRSSLLRSTSSRVFFPLFLASSCFSPCEYESSENLLPCYPSSRPHLYNQGIIRPRRCPEPPPLARLHQGFRRSSRVPLILYQTPTLQPTH